MFLREPPTILTRSSAQGLVTPAVALDHSGKTLFDFRGIAYTEGVIAGSPGLAMRSELPWVEVAHFSTLKALFPMRVRSAITPFG